MKRSEDPPEAQLHSLNVTNLQGWRRCYRAQIDSLVSSITSARSLLEEEVDDKP
ncbi:hypothetical protein F2Q69_00019632 [Brassica cretica]|uniref:Uncharacterized protein n=1 Tax=Brassica cretica TaxID=69181 RepID=A0A8S9Q2I7_BRACR|nr:hypothetical protein F2Q69_00019632 [Brassica cretica]